MKEPDWIAVWTELSCQSQDCFHAMENLAEKWREYAQDRYETGVADGAIKACLEE